MSNRLPCALLACALLLAGCGFQVRDAARLPPEMGSTQLVIDDEYSQLARRVRLMLEQSGVRVLAWVAGEWREVLEALSAGELTADRFIMAGCGRRRRGGGAARGRHRGGGRCG